MGVYIKGLKMPNDCRECPFEGYHRDIGQTYCTACLKVLATAFKPVPFDGRSKWCPLVEVPEPHGWLINEDNVIDVIHEMKDGRASDDESGSKRNTGKS
jgi:hypothetical protein